jgi:hypothetical protein
LRDVGVNTVANLVAAAMLWLIAVTAGLVKSNPFVTVAAIGILVTAVVLAWILAKEAIAIRAQAQDERWLTQMLRHPNYVYFGLFLMAVVFAQTYEWFAVTLPPTNQEEYNRLVAIYLIAVGLLVLVATLGGAYGIKSRLARSRGRDCPSFAKWILSGLRRAVVPTILFAVVVGIVIYEGQTR